MLFCLAGGALTMQGCGSPGSPQPPSLKLPEPPRDLAVARVGSDVFLHWTMPRRATDRVMLTGAQRAVVCRSLAPAPCTRLATLLLQPGVPATYRDSMTGTLAAGAPRLMIYTVLLQNRHGTSAGASNAAYTAAGVAPPAIVGLNITPAPQGILLHWQPAPQTAVAASTRTLPIEHLVRLQRSRLGTLNTKTPAQAGVAQPPEQALGLPDSGDTSATDAMDEHWSLEHAVDRDAALNQTYRYTAERVARLTLDGHPVEVASGPGQPATVEARDLFPPAVPQQLDAVADVDGGAIDLSWVANSEADLAGYFVYRRLARSSEAPVRVSGTAPLVDPGWRDTTVRAGVRYAYSVSAVDASGNESARSAEAEESMTPAPAQPAGTDTSGPAAKPRSVNQTRS